MKPASTHAHASTRGKARRVPFGLLAPAFIAVAVTLTACSSPPSSNAPPTTTPGATPTLFEGARLIIGDATPPIENSAFVVDAGRIGAVGRKGDVALPAGGTRVYQAWYRNVMAFCTPSGFNLTNGLSLTWTP